ITAEVYHAGATPWPSPNANGAAKGRPVSESVGCGSVGNRGLLIRREGGIDLGAAQQLVGERQRLVILRVRRDVGLRAGFLLALRLEVAAQRRFALRIAASLELVGHVLQHLDVGRNAFRLDRATRGREVARGGQAQRAVARPE